MKTTNKLHLIIFLISFQTVAFAQDKKPMFTFGVFAGMNTSKLESLDLATNKANAGVRPFSQTYQWTPSYNFGGTVTYSFSDGIYFESGLNFISKNAIGSPRTVVTLSFLGYDKTGKYSDFYRTYSTQFDYKSVSVQIPISIRFQLFQIKNFKCNAYAGYYWENMFYHNVEASFSQNYIPQDPPQSVIDEVTIIDKRISRFQSYQQEDALFIRGNVGYIIGLGFNFEKYGVDFSLNSPERNYGNVVYRIPSWAVNFHYQIN
jgi:hypothetical protein